MADLIFVKLGGSVITDKTVKDSLRKDVLAQIAKEISEVYKDYKLLIGHGGGSFAHPVAEYYSVNEGLKKCGVEGFVKTRKAVMELGKHVMNAFFSENVPAVYVPTHACTVIENGKIIEMFTKPIEKYLDTGMIPVMPGDACIDTKIGCSIASTEDIFNFLARKLSPQKVIFGSDIDGVLTGPPGEVPSKLISEISGSNIEEALKSVSKIAGFDVTGGMAQKIREMYALAQLGFEVQLVNLEKPGRLKKAILGEDVIGTKVIFKK